MTLPPEKVWDYPRPPRIATVAERIRVEFNGVVIADTTNAQRVLETSHPPTYYLPQEDIAMNYFHNAERPSSYCEWKGQAMYYHILVADAHAANAAWSYPDPKERFADIKDYIAFYPSRVSACYVGEERAGAQEGDFYGGWITANLEGPFKGPPGTLGW